jgi:predicted dehydrogenase
MTTTAPQADHLIQLAERHGLVLQAGHVERFNAAFEHAVARLPVARYFEATRASCYTFRSTDVGVVLDLMVHDIDLVCSLTSSPLVDARGTGIAVFGPHEDMAEARLEFADGTVANLRASRCSFQPCRQVAWYSEDGFVSADLAAGTVQSVGVSPAISPDTPRDVQEMKPAMRQAVRDDLFGSVLPLETVEVPPQNAIECEHRDFVHSIRTGAAPRVSGRDGRRAVAIAQSIIESINQHRWSDGTAHRTGAQTRRISLLPQADKRRAG